MTNQGSKFMKGEIVKGNAIIFSLKKKNAMLDNEIRHYQGEKLKLAAGDFWPAFRLFLDIRKKFRKDDN